MFQQAIPVLHVNDIARAWEFYRRQLGFVCVFGSAAGEAPRDPCYLGFARDGAELHVSSHAGDGVVGGVVYIRVDDVDRLHEELKRAGVAIHVGPVDQTWGLRELYVLDPFGNSIRFGAAIRR